jgi:hypothetical protein
MEKLLHNNQIDYNLLISAYLQMPVYHFVVDYSCEPDINNSTKTIVLIYDDFLSDATTKLENHIRKRPFYLGDLEKYNIRLDWIEDENGKWN